MAGYATLQDVKDFGSMPPEDVAALETQYAGITAKKSEAVSRLFDARLRKRYTVPFVAPLDPALVSAVAREVAWRLWLLRGYDPSGKLDQAIKDDHDDAQAWLKEAADGEKGLIEIAGATGTSAVVAPEPLIYSEQSPYVWADAQRDDAQSEDESRSGTLS